MDITVHYMLILCCVCAVQTPRQNSKVLVPGDCYNPLQEMSRNRLYRRAMPGCLPPGNVSCGAVWIEILERSPLFGQRNMDEKWKRFYAGVA